MATRWDDTQRRWFVDGEPVHAGAGLEMQGVVLEYDDDGEETGVVAHALPWSLSRATSGTCVGVRVKSGPDLAVAA